MNWRIGDLARRKHESSCGVGLSPSRKASAARRGLGGGGHAGQSAVANSAIHQFTNSPTHQSGFTLIELLVVMSLIVILSAMALVQYRNSVVRAKEATLKNDLFGMRDAIDQYYADKNQYPATLDALVSDGYLRALPKDPFTESSSSWQAVPAEPDPNNPIAEPGVYDVKSGSDATALDGSKYSEW